jgi:hypothetical protein
LCTVKKLNWLILISFTHSTTRVTRSREGSTVFSKVCLHSSDSLRYIIYSPCFPPSINHQLPAYWTRRNLHVFPQKHNTFDINVLPAAPDHVYFVLLLGDYSQFRVAKKRREDVDRWHHRVLINCKSKSLKLWWQRLIGLEPVNGDLLKGTSVSTYMCISSCIVDMCVYLCLTLFLSNIPLGPSISSSSPPPHLVCLCAGQLVAPGKGLSVILTTLNLISVCYMWPSWALSCMLLVVARERGRPGDKANIHDGAPFFFSAGVALSSGVQTMWERTLVSLTLTGGDHEDPSMHQIKIMHVSQCHHGHSMIYSPCPFYVCWCVSAQTLLVSSLSAKYSSAEF